MASPDLVLWTIPIDIIGGIIDAVETIDVLKLWTTGDSKLQSRLMLKGVVKTLQVVALVQFPSILAKFPHLERLYLRERYTDYLYGHTMDYFSGFEPQRLPTSLRKLGLCFPNALERLCGHSLNKLYPNLAKLSLSQQYVPKAWQQVLLQDLPPLTQLNLPDNLPLQVHHIESLPRTLTELQIKVDYPEKCEDQVRNALNWPALRVLSLAGPDLAVWPELAPENVEEYRYRDNLAPKNMNNPLGYQEVKTMAYLRNLWVPAEYTFPLLPHQLQVLHIGYRHSDHLLLEHIFFLPRTLTTLQFGAYYTWDDRNFFEHDESVLPALPPSLTLLTTPKFIISSLEAFALIPPQLKKWNGLFLDPLFSPAINTDLDNREQNFVYTLPPGMEMPEFVTLTDAQLLHIPSSCDSFPTDLRNTSFTAAVGATAISKLPLRSLRVTIAAFYSDASPIMALLRLLPTTLTSLELEEPPTGELPQEIPWQQLTQLRSLHLPTDYFFQVASVLPSSITSLALNGSLPSTRSDSWQIQWPAALKNLRISLGTAFLPAHMYLWPMLPSTLRSFDISASSYQAMPEDWSCLRCLDLIDLRVDREEYSFRFSDSTPLPSLELMDCHLKGLPPRLLTLGFAEWEHRLTLDGFLALPKSLHSFCVGKKNGSKPWKACFASAFGGRQAYLRPAETIRAEAPFPKHILDYILSKRQFYLLCQNVPTVDFVAPPWPDVDEGRRSEKRSAATSSEGTGARLLEARMAPSLKTEVACNAQNPVELSFLCPNINFSDIALQESYERPKVRQGFSISPV